MNKSIYRKTLDVQKHGVQFTVSANRNEALSRQIIFSIVDGGKPFDFGNGSLTVILFAAKPDGNFVYNACTVDGNSVTYVFTQQTLAVAGEVNARLLFIASDDVDKALEVLQNNAVDEDSVVQILYSPEFIIDVEDVADYDNAIESTNEYTALTIATANAQDITDIVTQKLENGEFNGPQGIQGPPGEPGTTDYLKLLNKPIVDIDIAGITDFYFREQIPGSAKSPCFYRIVSSDDSVFQIENVYLDENHKDEPVYEYLTVGDTFFVFDVFDNTSDGYRLSALPLVQSDNIMQLLYLCTIDESAVQKIYYAPLSTYEQLVQMIRNLNDSFNDLKTQEKLDIEQLQSQTEQKLSTKANKVSWRKIFEITTTEKVSVVEQSVDSSGKPFKLSQARIIISIPSHLGPDGVAIDQPAVAYHPETDTDWYSLYGDSIGKSQAFLIFEIKAEPFVFGELTTMPSGSGFSNGSPLDKNTASVCCGGRYDIDYIDYFKLQDTSNTDATFPANTKITMWGIDKND